MRLHIRDSCCTGGWACRYLNSVAAKALFRAGRIEEAEAMAAKFTKHGDQVNSLTEMQAMWYEIECGHAHLCRRAYGKVRLLLKIILLPQHCCMGKNYHDKRQSLGNLEA